MVIETFYAKPSLTNLTKSKKFRKLTSVIWSMVGIGILGVLGNAFKLGKAINIGIKQSPIC